MAETIDPSMKSESVELTLPLPWTPQSFTFYRNGAVHFLVGPNGSGKSRFAQALQDKLWRCRLLGSDRLTGMEGPEGFRQSFGDHFPDGIPKHQFPGLKRAGKAGSGMDAFILLVERFDIRIRVEATLSHLFNREITLVWDSGNLLPKASLGRTTALYRLDRDECHGIKELLVLLTHLYSDEHSQLIIDEPELNLHPQYQTFFMDEVFKVAGNFHTDKTKKAIFLITHSPFILKFTSACDIKSVVSFDINFSVPKQIHESENIDHKKLSTLIPRLNAHHKQFFFADNPVFVEGILDAQLIEALQMARGASIAGAGSCVIDVGGAEEVNQYLLLCRVFGKNAHFIYDLDSLFNGNLRQCIQDDGTVGSFLRAAGIGDDFAQYCGDLDKLLSKTIDCLLIQSRPGSLLSLIKYFNTLGNKAGWDRGKLRKARTALLTGMSRFPEDAKAAIGKDFENIQGRLGKILELLKNRNIHVLPGGTIERYLPMYEGDLYDLSDDKKRKAVSTEIQALSLASTPEKLFERYGELYAAICQLPSRKSVDIKPVLRKYLGHYIHDLQSAVVAHPSWQKEQLQAHLDNVQSTACNVFVVESFNRDSQGGFKATVAIYGLHRTREKIVRIDQTTNSGMGTYEIEEV